MTPREASLELARIEAVVRTTGLHIVLWRGASGGLALVALLAVAAWLPYAWLQEAGSPLPMLFAVASMAAAGLAGLIAGRSVSMHRLHAMAEQAERATGLARGELVGALELGAEANLDSPDLARLHRRRVADALSGKGPRVLMPESFVALRRVRSVVLLGLAAAAGALTFGSAAGPSAGTDAATVLIRPWTVSFPPPPPSLRLEPAGGHVLRGEIFPVRVMASGRRRVTLGQAGSGAPAVREELAVAREVAVGVIAPVDDPTRYWAEDDRGAVTDTFLVVPVDPLTITDLQIGLTYPSYLRRPAETIGGPITALTVPVGTGMDIRARMNHAVGGVGLQRFTATGIDTVVLDVTGNVARGVIRASGDARLAWWLQPAGEVPGVKLPPAIHLSVIQDAAPSIAIVYPGEDRMLGIDRSLALVIEARDDNGITGVNLVWWRESAMGLRDPESRIALAEGDAARRLVLRPTIDLDGQGFFPGDEVVYYATATDGNPSTRPVASDTFRVRLSSLEDMRREAARRLETLAEAARSLDEMAGRLADDARDASRRAASGGEEPDGRDIRPNRADFAGTEEARDLLSEARDVESALERMREELADMRRDLASAPLSAPDLRSRLEQLEELYKEILESDLGARIEALEEAMRGLDREQMRRALSDLARDSDTLEERLYRALGLMERVALEQSLKGAVEKVRALAERQERAARSIGFDDEWASVERDLASVVDDLAREVESLSDRLETQQAGESAEKSRRAASDMRSARNDIRSAVQEFEKKLGREAVSRRRSAQTATAASEQLKRAEEELTAASEALSNDWREEALEAVDLAATEALELAKEQQRIVEQLRDGTPLEGLSRSQAALREGLDNLSQALADAGRKTALLDRRSGTAAAEAGEEMDALGQSLAGGAVRRAEAIREGEAVVQALADLAGSLVASRQAMAEANSATGMEEALERLALMGQRQAGINADAGELFLLSRGGQQLDDRLGELAGRQEEIARGLAELAVERAAGELGGRPGDLAAEAEQIARRLADGALDQETMARQERLFRRLLDAGRSLEQDDEDSRKRESTTARVGVILVPEDATGVEAGPRFPYPDESRMHELTSVQRRLVYDYFDRLNAVETGGTP